jgi:Dyp-type peroxidase family
MDGGLLPDEPVLRTDRIQGNVLAGFLTDQQLHVGFKIADGARARSWLAGQAEKLATVDDVLAQRAQMKERRFVDQPGGVWANLALSHAALRTLGAPSNFLDDSFAKGLATRARSLGDRDPDPSRWIVGGNVRRLDVLLILGGEPDRLVAHADELTRSAVAAGLEESYRELGSTVPGRGVEHFGFRDGISQPGILGRLLDGKPLTERPVVEGGPTPEAGRGQPLIWPGQFAFGYPHQNPATPRFPGHPAAGGRDEETKAFATDGSLLVFRRLAQDVPAFKAFLDQQAAELRAAGFSEVTPHRVGAQLVGRWPSGAPLDLAPDADNQELAKSNAFDFSADIDGLRCPLAAHIRKVNPRGGQSDRANPLQTRILRRGIPYGPFADEEDPQPAERGLLFLCYQTSIVEQFEFLTRVWMNSAAAPAPGGHDLLVGQPPGCERTMTLRNPGTEGSHELRTAIPWITPTGGEYLFAPSKPALASLAA